ncbi:glycosyltransferase family 2 protein [Dactylosporangium sucinum]|uniref:Glycosyl transferase n=1 Tax=Dactylosporangium sucinum TaxID=1424081 RepID=A0A917TZ27_9ACTN|nr:glycosyltransferase family 2 protein [Dactylosporangium sucinum]GGM45369.1 glycosyl transferase [Dactylosporangium sucinum]
MRTDSELGGMPSLTAFIPCYNEVAQVDAVHAAIDAELSRYPDLEILFVDDGSTDGTLAKVKALCDRDPRVRYVSFSRNFGLEAAHGAGFRYASRDWVVQLDADLQSPPAEAHKLIAKALEGYDVVYGIRRERHDPLFRRLGSAVQQRLAQRLFGVDLVYGSSVFRVVRAGVARRAVDLRLATPYFVATMPLLGARWATVDVEHRRRQDGGSRWAVWRLFAHSGELFFGFSVRPLTWIYLAVALVLPFVVAAGSPGAVAGLVVLLGSVAILAAYVHRLVRGGVRPALYYVREANIPIAAEDSLYAGEPLTREPVR